METAYKRYWHEQMILLRSRSRLYRIVMWIIKLLIQIVTKENKEFQGFVGLSKEMLRKDFRQLFRGFEYGMH